MPVHVPGVFVTGTDTDVGKTFVSNLICRHYREIGVNVGAYKPACSGADMSAGRPAWQDIEVLHDATGAIFERERISPQRFIRPLAPPVAARLEECQVDRELLISGAKWWETNCEFLVVEGVGGWLCPLTETETVADFAVELGLPLLIVARAGLGTINHTLLTVESALARKCRISGVVLNEGLAIVAPADIEMNAAEIERRSGVPVVATVRRMLPEPGKERMIRWRDILEGAVGQHPQY